MIQSISFSYEVECLAYLLVGGCLIDAYVADVVEQCEVDGVRRVLLVVAHEVEQSRVVVACERHCTVVLAYEASRLMETGGWKSGFACTDV